jgi:hypothetical protein
MALRAAGEDDHDDDLKDVKVRLGALEKAVSKLTESGGRGSSTAGASGGEDAHPLQQQQQEPTMLVPAEETSGVAADILRAKLELTNEIRKVGKDLATERSARLEGTSAKLDETSAKLEGTNAKLDGTSARLTPVAGDIAGLRLDVQGLRGEIELGGQGLQGEIKREIPRALRVQ